MITEDVVEKQTKILYKKNVVGVNFLTVNVFFRILKGRIKETKLEVHLIN